MTKHVQPIRVLGHPLVASRHDAFPFTYPSSPAATLDGPTSHLTFASCPGSNRRYRLGVGWKQEILPFRESVPPASGETITVGAQCLPVHFKRNARARHYLLYVRKDRSLRVTLPPRGSLREARAFVASRSAWIQRQLAKIDALPLAGKAWQPGQAILLHGRDTVLEEHHEKDQRIMTLGPLRFPAPDETLDLRPLVESHLQQYAKQFLPVEVSDWARKHDWNPRRITVRNQSTRWGSCSEKGTISLNWRLVQVPREVCDYVILHELCHLDHLNHSRAFWNRLHQVCPDYRAHEAWLKAHTARLGL